MAIVLTHNAKYKPMSFDDMIKPYIMATEEYRKLESGIADLEAQAESVKQQALLEPEGSKARKQYEDYSKKLEQTASDLASKGLKGVNRKSVLDLNTQYKSSIKPIEDLIKYRSDIAEEQRKLDPKFVVDRDFSQVTLDELMANPNLGYTKYDLEDYGKQAVLEGTSMKAEMSPTYLGKDPTDQNLLYSQGMSDNDLQSWLSGTSNEELDAAVDRIAGNAPQAVRDRVKTDLAKSLRATVSTKENKAYDYAKRKDLALYQHNLKEQSEANKEARKVKEQAEKDMKAKIDERQRMLNYGIITSRGFVGEYSDSTKQMEGIVGTETPRLTSLNAQLEKAKNNYINYLQNNNIEDPQSIIKEYNALNNEINSLNNMLEFSTNESEKLEIGLKILELRTELSKYNNFVKVYNDYLSVENEISKEKHEIQDFANKYFYLGDTDEERIERGLALQKAVEGQTTDDIHYNLNSTDYNKVVTGISNVLKGLDRQQVGKTAGLVDSDGKILSYENMQNILNSKDLQLKVIKEKNKDRFVIVSNGEEYTTKGINDITNWTDNVTSVNNYLSDFNVGYTESPRADLKFIGNNNKESDTVKDLNDLATALTNNNILHYISKIDLMKLPNVGNQGLKGLTVVDDTNHTIYKILVDSSGKIKGYNTTDNEISGGILRSQYTDELIKVGMQNLQNRFALE